MVSFLAVTNVVIRVRESTMNRDKSGREKGLIGAWKRVPRYTLVKPGT